MSNIDKLALPELREMFEAWWEVNYHNGNPPRFGWAAWRDGDGYKIDDDEPELDGMWQAWQAAHSGKLGAAEKRIAELQARDITIKQHAQALFEAIANPSDHYVPAYARCLREALNGTSTGKGE